MKRFFLSLLCAFGMGGVFLTPVQAIDETIANRISGYVSHPNELPMISESQSASDLAAFYGYEIQAMEILSLLPKSDDPTVGFVGDPKGKPSLPPESYGVYPEPVVETLKMAGIPAVSLRNATIETLKETIAEGHPVVCWVVGRTAPGKAEIYRTEAGNEVRVARQMNTVTVDGFNDAGFSVWDNGVNYFRTFRDFEDSWKILGYQGLRINENSMTLVETEAVSKPKDSVGLEPYLQGTAIPLYTLPAAETPTPEVQAGNSADWWNEGQDQYWQSSKEALTDAGLLSAETNFWTDEALVRFGEIPTVEPIFGDTSAWRSLSGYETWFTEAGADSSAAPLPPTIWQQFGTDSYSALLPPSAVIDGFVGYAQSYNLDCETRSAIDLASYHGVKIDYMSFLTGLPKSDDPNEGFVGNYWDPRGGLPPNGYGVYEQPIADQLSRFGLASVGVANFTWEMVKAQVSVGNPVMVWVVGNTTEGTPVPYMPANGRTTVVVPYQHTVVVVGYDETAGTVSLQDGGMRYTRGIQTFLNSWAVLGNRAVFRQD